MCTIKDMITEEFKNANEGKGISSIFKSEEIEKVADRVRIILVEQYAQLNKNKFDITEAAVNMDFVVYNSIFDNDNVSAIIEIEKTNNKTRKEISANSNDSLEHIRFAVAHELGHYFFDYNKSDTYFSDTYTTDERVGIPTESRASRFAAAILMPIDKFQVLFTSYANTYKYDLVSIIESLSSDFGVSVTAIKKRIAELSLIIKDIGNYLSEMEETLSVN